MQGHLEPRGGLGKPSVSSLSAPARRNGSPDRHRSARPRLLGTLHARGCPPIEADGRRPRGPRGGRGRATRPACDRRLRHFRVPAGRDVSRAAPGTHPLQPGANMVPHRRDAMGADRGAAGAVVPMGAGRPGQGSWTRRANPSVGENDRDLRWFARYERLSQAPGALYAEARRFAETDVRGVLSSIQIPTLVFTGPATRKKGPSRAHTTSPRESPARPSSGSTAATTGRASATKPLSSGRSSASSQRCAKRRPSSTAYSRPSSSRTLSA
jgi:hypothetical protein